MATTELTKPTTDTSAKPAGTEHFPPFNLGRLLKTVFDPRPGERVAILIDLDDPRGMKDYGFLQNPGLTIQAHAYHDFQQALKNGLLAELNLRGGEMFAFEKTGGSNLDLPDRCASSASKRMSIPTTT
jgi:aminopeptidase